MLHDNYCCLCRHYRWIIVFAVLKNKTDNALSKRNFEDLRLLDDYLRLSFSRSHEGAKCEGSCIGNQLLTSLAAGDRFSNKTNSTALTWPAFVDEETFSYVILPGLVGRPRVKQGVNGTDVLEAISGLNLRYQLSFESERWAPWKKKGSKRELKMILLSLFGRLQEKWWIWS